MTFPVVAGFASSAEIADTTSHNVALPAGIVAGDLLIAAVSLDGVPSLTWPAGWTLLVNLDNGSNRQSIRYRIADGTEGATIVLTSGNLQESAHQVFRITGYTGVPEASGPASGTNVNPDSPSLTPSWGAKDTLWLAIAASDTSTTYSAGPTNYTNLTGNNSGGATGVSVGSARRNLNTATENPGIFTQSAAVAWLASTVAVRPVPDPVAPVLSQFTGDFHVITWSNLDGQNGDAQPLSDLHDYTAAHGNSIQVFGNFGGGSVTMQGSNDGINWATLSDYVGNPLVFTAPGIKTMRETPRFLRPACTTIAANVIMALKLI